MKYVLRSFFRPVDNRHYAGRKASAALYAAKFVPITLICIFGAVTFSPVLWLVLLAVIIVGCVDYLIFDAFMDKLSWRLLWRRFYGDELHEPTPDHHAMKAFEANPSVKNYRKLKQQLQRNKER